MASSSVPETTGLEIQTKIISLPLPPPQGALAMLSPESISCKRLLMPKVRYVRSSAMRQAYAEEEL